MNEQTISIPARLKNMAKDGHVAGTEDIVDDALNKTQKEINTEVDIEINADGMGIKDRLSTLEQQVSFDGDIQVENDPANVTAGNGKVTTANAVRGAIVVATLTVVDVDELDNFKETTLRNASNTQKYTLASNNKNVGTLQIISDQMGHVVTQIVTTHYLYNDTNGTIDWTSHLDNNVVEVYRSVKVQGGTLPDNNWTRWNYVNNEVLSALQTGIDSVIFDVSAKNPTAGPNNDGKFESLSALLSDANLNTLIPIAVRKGGMSIKFVQSSDNKYVQYRLMSDTFNTTKANWQGVDAEPTPESKNLVESGGVKKSATVLEYGFIGNANTLVWSDDSFKVIAGHTYRLFIKDTNVDMTDVTEGYILIVNTSKSTSTPLISVAYNSVLAAYYDVVIPNGVNELWVGGRCAANVGFSLYVEDITSTKFSTGENVSNVSLLSEIVVNSNDPVKSSEISRKTQELTTLFEQGVYYQNNTVGTAIIRQTGTAGYSSIKIHCAKGDVFRINGVGGGFYRLWSTSSADGEVIRCSDANLDYTTISGNVAVVAIEDNETILVVNTITSSVTANTSRVVNSTIIQKSLNDIGEKVETLATMEATDISTLQTNIGNLSGRVTSNTNQINSNIVAIASKQNYGDGYLYGGFVAPSSTPVVLNSKTKYIYTVTTEGTYINCGNLVVNRGEICLFRREPEQDNTPVTWSKVVLAKTGARIIAAYDADAAWKALANYTADSINNGLARITEVITNYAKDGDTIVLSPGTFGGSGGVAINKNLTIIGQGLNTVLSRSTDSAEMFIEKDNLNVTVKGVNVAHCVRINAKNTISHYNSSLVLENIYIDGTALDTDLINEVYRKKYPTIAHPKGIYKWYGTYTASASNPIGTVAAFTSGTSFLPNSSDIEQRTCRLLPGDYYGTGGVSFSRTLPTRLMGFKGYEKDTIIRRTNYQLDFPNDIYVSGISGSEQTDVEIRVENLSVAQLVNFRLATNFHCINCYRGGVKLDDYDGGNVLKVGRDKTFALLSHAIYVAKGLTVVPTKRILIEVYGEIRDYNVCEATAACIDIEGYDNATVMRIGNTVNTSNITGSNPVFQTGANWDGYVKNITFKLVGIFKNYSFPAIFIKDTKKALFENVKAYALNFAGKGVPLDDSLPWDANTNALKYRHDQERRCVVCVADAESSTGYTAHIYDQMWGTEIGSYECSAADAAASHPYYVTIRKPDSEISKEPEDVDGGRRYGIYISVPNEGDVKLKNCEGYGSPWGFHNTRGIYVDYGSPTLINCIGVSGGIGTRCCGIIFHRNTEAEAIGCIGYASPFSYLGADIPDLNNFESVGIKFQAQAASKITNCIGYGNDQPLGHGIHCDMRVTPTIINCVGYTNGGENAGGFCIEEFATAKISGGYFGKRLHSISRDFTNNNGNGMNFYPYRRPVRHDTTTDDVIYGNHWEEVLDNTEKAYKIESIMFSCKAITQSSAMLNKYVRFWDVNNSTSEKTLVAECKMASGHGTYYYVNFYPYQTGNQSYDIVNGHHLYIAIEEENGTELTVADGILNANIQPTLVTSDLATGASGMFNWQYRARMGAEVNPLNPYTPINQDFIAHGVLLDSNGASLRIGEKADIAKRYIITNSTFKGEIVRDVPTGEDIRVYNSVQINDNGSVIEI